MTNNKICLQCEFIIRDKNKPFNSFFFCNKVNKGVNKWNYQKYAVCKRDDK